MQHAQLPDKVDVRGNGKPARIHNPWAVLRTIPEPIRGLLVQYLNLAMARGDAAAGRVIDDLIQRLRFHLNRGDVAEERRSLIESLCAGLATNRRAAITLAAACGGRGKGTA